MKFSVPDHILSIQAYVPGKPIEELEREYGITDSVKLASNENPLGPSPLAIAAIQNALTRLNRYPDGAAFDLINAIAGHLINAGAVKEGLINIGPENIVVGNGSDDIIGLLAQTLLQPGDEVILPQPSFLMYEISTLAAGAKPVFSQLNSFSIDLEDILTKVNNKTRLIYICNPNNPTGTVLSQFEFEKFIAALPAGIVVVVDEAYIEFIRSENCLDSLRFLESDCPIVILRTFSKAYGLAGLRVGYGIMPVYLAQILNRVRQPFNVNLLAQAGAVAALRDEPFLVKTVKMVHDGLDYLYKELEKLKIDYFPTESNFLMIDIKRDANQFFEEMLKQGVIIRSMASYGYPGYIRITVGLPEENEKFIQALNNINLK